MEDVAPRRSGPKRNLTLASVAGALVAAFAASACCLGPLLFAALGIGGAGLLLKLEPYRPWFAALTLVLLGAGFHLTYRRPSPTAATGAPGPACACKLPRAALLGRVALWVATAAVAVVLAFPYLADTLFP